MTIQTGDRESRRKKTESRHTHKKKEVYLCRNVLMLYVYLSVKERLSFSFLSQGRRDMENGFSRLLVWERKRLGKKDEKFDLMYRLNHSY